MATREETRLIKDSKDVEHKYYVRQMPPTKALPLKFELVKIIGSALPTLLKSKGKTDDKQAKAFTQALEALFCSVSGERLTTIIKTCIETATRDGNRIMDATEFTFDNIYADEYKEMYAAFFFVLEVNYGNFIKGFGLNLEKLKEKMEPKSYRDNTES